MVKTLCLHCRGHRFNPWSGTEIPHALRCSQKLKCLKKTKEKVFVSAAKKCGIYPQHNGKFSVEEVLAYLWRRQWHTTPVLLPGKSHGWKSLVGCRPWGRYESDTTERLHFHFSLSCIGEGSGNPLQYSCLENPRDGGAWWAAIYGVAQSRTRLKRLSSSSSNIFMF